MPCTSSEGFTSKALYIPCIIKRTDTHMNHLDGTQVAYCLDDHYHLKISKEN